MYEDRIEELERRIDDEQCKLIELEEKFAKFTEQHSIEEQIVPSYQQHPANVISNMESAFEIVSLILQYKKIEAIREIRKLTGLGLVDSKSVMEQYEKKFMNDLHQRNISS